MKTASVVATKIGNIWQIRGYTRPYVDILRANECTWDGKKLAWEHVGAELPPVVKQIIDGTYGLDANSPISEPNSGNFEKQVSEAELTPRRAKRPYSRKAAGLFEKGAAVEWDSPSGVVCGEYLKPEDATRSRVRLGSAELVIHNDLLREATPVKPIVIIDMEQMQADQEALRKQADTLANELGYSLVASVSRDDPNLAQKLAEAFAVAMGRKFIIHTEPDGTCPYMVENQRDLKPGQDWLGWMTCCECGLFLDLESNRKAGSKPLMGVGNGKVICRNCHRVKHNLPTIKIDAPKAITKPTFDTTLYGFLEGHWHIKQTDVESALCGVDWYGLGVHRLADEMQLTPMCRTCVDIKAGQVVNGKLKTSAAALKNAANFRVLADRMQKDIDHHMRPFGDRNVTRKRQQEYESRMADGRNLQKVQANLRALADAIEQGRLPEILQGIRTKWSVEWLTFRDWMPLPEHRYNETERNNLLKAGINEFNYYQAYAAMQALGDGKVGEETPAQKLEALRMEVARKNIPDYFPTPPDVIDVLMRHVTPNAGEAVLEPSAGSGHIAQVVRERYPDAVLSVIEYHVTLQEILKLQGFDLVGDDFFAHDRQYDFIVQNPPFTDMADIDHVRHAYRCLKAGGRLVSVMSKSWQFRRDKKAVAFREWLEMVGGHAEDLPNGAFKASERSTGVVTCYVVIDRE